VVKELEDVELGDDTRIHVGLYRYVLKGVLEATMAKGTPFNHSAIFNYLFNPALLLQDFVRRCYSITTDGFVLAPNEKKVIRNILSEPLEPFRGENQRDYVKLARACVILINNVLDFQVVHFATPLTERVMFELVYPRQMKPEDYKPASLLELATDAISLFSTQALKNSKLSTTSLGLPIETVLQQQFAISLSLLVPPTVTMSAEMAYFVKGRVDFYIGSWGCVGNSAIELMRDGKGISRHQRKYKRGGKYYAKEIKQSIVLDFRAADTTSKYLDSQRVHGVYYAIIFAKDFESVIVVRNQETIASIQLNQRSSDVAMKHRQ